MKRQAFTIVELLAVVGIILIIMSLIVPSASKAMEKADIAAAKATLEKIEMAIRNYQTAYGRWPPDLSYKYLGQKLPSYNFGAVLPLLGYEKDQLMDPNAGDARAYKDPWGQEYQYYWIGQDTALSAIGDPKPTRFKTEFENNLVANGKFLQTNSHLSDVIDPPTLPINANTKLIPSFLIWSKGPEMNTGTADDIGNWGKTRNKMVSGVS